MQKLLEITFSVLNFMLIKLWQLAKVSKFPIANFANCYNIEMLRLLNFFGRDSKVYYFCYIFHSF